MKRTDSATGSCVSGRFEVTQLAAGLIQPMELAVAPDGTVYFIEVNGMLKAINPGAVTTKSIRRVPQATLAGRILLPTTFLTQTSILQRVPLVLRST